MDATLSRGEFVRPVVVALCLTLSGELLIFVLWGMALFPEGALWRKLAWTMTCGVGMGLAVGALVNVFVSGRLGSYVAGLAAGTICFLVLSFCVGLCYQIDLSIDFFGAREAPLLFILGGVVPAFLTSFGYGWILYSRTGRQYLARLGMS